MVRALLFLVLSSILAGVQAELSLNQLFSDGMILQTNKDYGARSFVYGSGSPGEQVLIAGLPRRSAKGQPYPTTVDASGKFRVQLDPVSATMASFTMTVSGSKSTNKITVKDVLYGDVILCGGQSNMVKPMNYIFNASAEIAAATFPNMRLFTVPSDKAGSPTPQDRFDDAACSARDQCVWTKLSPAAVANFSAVCYLTAKELVQRQIGQKYPIGLVFSAVGGTEVQQWMPKDALTDCANTTRDPSKVSGLFNGMIAPLVGYSLKMTLWYQVCV
jgi:sialate O-acetylesterase